MTEIVVTIKGKGKDEPWLVIHGSTVDEVNSLMLEAELKLLSSISRVERAFERRHMLDVPDHDGAVALVQAELGGVTISELESVASDPRAPWQVQDAAQRTLEAASAVTAKPWEKPAPAPAPKPWEKKALPSAPKEEVTYEYTGPRVRLVYVDTASLDGADKDAAMAWIEKRKNAMARAYADHGNSFGYNKDEKCYRFHHNPNSGAVEWLNGFLAEYGGDIL